MRTAIQAKTTSKNTTTKSKNYNLQNSDDSIRQIIQGSDLNQASSFRIDGGKGKQKKKQLSDIDDINSESAVFRKKNMKKR